MLVCVSISLGLADQRLASGLPWPLGAAYTALFLIGVAFFPLDKWLSASPTEDWKRKAKEVDTTIILGFGYAVDKAGAMKPGKANRELLDWTMAHTQASIILVQEGVWVAACDGDAETCSKAGRQIRRIHRHCPETYLNTLDTACCALQVMERLGKKEAVLVTHDVQLRRAVWDFERVKRSREAWQDVRFVVPDMPDIAYPADSVHLQTRSEWIWRIVELLVSRPRDFLSTIPDTCKVPCLLIGSLGFRRATKKRF
jgi:hypothetical protein